MRKIAASIALVSIITSVSCGLKEQKAITTDQLHAIEDGIPKIIPSVTLINTRQNGEDLCKVRIILGDPAFYGAPDAEKQSKAVAVGQLVLNTLGADNCLTNGTLVITKDVRNQEERPADGIELDMKLDSLNKVLFKK